MQTELPAAAGASAGPAAAGGSGSEEGSDGLPTAPRLNTPPAPALWPTPARAQQQQRRHQQEQQQQQQQHQERLRQRQRQGDTWERGSGSWVTSPTSFDRRLNLIGLVLHGVTQVLELLHWASLPWSERFQRVLSIIFACIPYLASALVPGFYIRHRKPLVLVFRIVFFSFPLLRKPRGIQRVLDGEPQAGPLGILQDLYKVIWGSRLVAVVFSGIITPLPLLLHLLAQSYAVAMVRSNGTLCLAPLLTHPTTARRIRSFHRLLQAASQPFGTGVLAWSSLSFGDQEAECQAFLTFLHLLVGLVLATVLVVKTRADMSAKSWREAGSRGSFGAVWLEAATARLERFMRLLCGSSWLAVEPPRPQPYMPHPALARSAAAGGGGGSGGSGRGASGISSSSDGGGGPASASAGAYGCEQWEQHGGEEEAECEEAGVLLMRRLVVWFMLLSLLHGLAVAIS